MQTVKRMRTLDERHGTMQLFVRLRDLDPVDVRVSAGSTLKDVYHAVMKLRVCTTVIGPHALAMFDGGPPLTDMSLPAQFLAGATLPFVSIPTPDALSDEVFSSLPAHLAMEVILDMWESNRRMPEGSAEFLKPSTCRVF